MKLFPFRFYIFLFLVSANTFSQPKIITTLKPLPVKDTVSPWKSKNIIGFDLNQNAFVNWSAGGVSSVSGLIKGNITRIYSRKNVLWFNEFILRYGLNKQDGQEMRKTEDTYRFNSTIGYRNDTLSNWYHSAKFNFNTQFMNGYNYLGDNLAISKPFAPAYIFLGVGAEYANKEEKLNFYISPLTMKNTLVLDARLANQGAFGVIRAEYDANGILISNGKKAKTELGFLVSNHFKREIVKNINMENRLTLYSDYINQFGNIDIDWQMIFDLVVNQYVRANIGFNLVYDDDIKAKRQIDGMEVIVGPKVQLKQMLGVGLVYEF